MAWIDNYDKLQIGCSFTSKKDSYDFEWDENNSFPEKNGIIECIGKYDLSLDSLDTLTYKCIETSKIVVKNGKIVGGKGECLNAMSETLIRRTYMSNGKSKATMFFPEKIALSLNENGTYSISSKKRKLSDLEFDVVMRVFDFVKVAKSLSYLHEINKVEFEWTKTGQIKNIRVKEYNGGNKILGRANIPLNAKGEMHGISEIYTGASGNFKIEWNNGEFKRIFDGNRKLKQSLCPDYVCRSMIDRLQRSALLHHTVPIMESTRDVAEQGLSEGWMLHYIAYLLGITINQALVIWDTL